MKRGLLTLAFVLMCASGAMAQATVTFAWDAYAPRPSGFEMTLTPAAGSAIVQDCRGGTGDQCTVPAIPAGNWTAFCRAYNVGLPAPLSA